MFCFQTHFGEARTPFVTFNGNIIVHLEDTNTTFKMNYKFDL